MYSSAKKCDDKLIVLGFMVSARGIEVDKEKVKSIKEWPTPTIASEVRSFHGLASFYRRFVKDFNSIADPLNEFVKKDVNVAWSDKQEAIFTLLKENLCYTPILTLPIFNKNFELESDSSSVSIGVTP